MNKVVTCPMCLGQGMVGVFARSRCKDCEGRGWLTVPMSRADQVRAMSDEEMAEVLLNMARDPRWNDDGHMFELWCDDCGGCKGMAEEEFDHKGCSDEMQLACVLRYLRAPGEDDNAEM